MYMHTCHIYTYISDNWSDKVQKCLSHQIIPHKLFIVLQTYDGLGTTDSPNICIMLFKS